MLALLRGDYVATYFQIAQNGFFFVSQPWVHFKRSVEHTMQWSDALTAARVRYDAVHEMPVITPNTKAKLAKLVDEADEAESKGKLPDDRWRAQNETVLDEISKTTPWLAAHKEITNPFLIERAAKVAEVEQNFLTQRVATLAKAPKSILIYRVEMIKRNALGEVAETAKQVQLRDPEIGDQFPFARYDTRDDVGVRPTHAAMNGFVALRTWDGWKTVRPKNGFNCRCITVFVTMRQAMERGWADDQRKPKFIFRFPNSASEKNYNDGTFPDKGWHGPKFWTP